MKAISLYKLTEDFTALMESDDDISNELANIIAGEIETKAENICKFLTVLESTAEQFKAEEKRISEARKVLEHKAERTREYIKQALLSANIDKLTAGTFKISVGLSAGSIQIDNADLIPAKFMTIIPESYVPDKSRIKEAIKNKENVPGAHIESGFTLRIK